MGLKRNPKPADASRDVPVYAEAPIAVVKKNLGEDVRVSLGSYAGLVPVDVRTFMDLRDGVRRATKKGISLKVQRLPELIAALQLAEAAAVERGLLKATGADL